MHITEKLFYIAMAKDTTSLLHVSDRQFTDEKSRVERYSNRVI
ncbi:hypothetical protein SDC9_108069 [bioreactor metagenome]|uniref:Uncharacterized protein n=1 Tax=bioreactor metagenome TaxID=1076179 RepID=A0A645B720_9ZZZZ